MVTITDVKSGLTKYLEQELLAKINGWQKWIVAAGLNKAMENGNALFELAKNNEVVKMLDVIRDDGMIDIETIYNYVLPEAQKSAAVIKIPLIGEVTIHAEDVEKLYRCIIS